MDTEKVTLHMLKHVQYNVTLQIKRTEAIEKALLASLNDLDIIIEHIEQNNVNEIRRLNENGGDAT